MIKILIFLIFLPLINGCSLVYQHQSRTTNEKLMQLNVGMPRSEVLTILGNPYRREAYGEDEYLIYETNHRAISEKDRFTPIFVKSGMVVGWGRNYFDDAMRSKIDADITIKHE